MYLACVLVLLGGACHAPSSIEAPCADPVWVDVVEVVDGDTLDVDPPVALPGGDVPRIRLLCIDAPEVWSSPECFGEEARAYARARVEGTRVQLVFDRDCTDTYGRGLAYVKTRSALGTGALFNLELVREGYAVMIDDFFADYTWCPEIAEAEAEARAEGAGGWGACSGDPWDVGR
ncbi:MAG: thermonuclease family protein [Deltaproteobacteria bacterium]|nr:thermonuclease family protein [Deltaproteobacteria bacterium]